MWILTRAAVVAAGLVSALTIGAFAGPSAQEKTLGNQAYDEMVYLHYLLDKSPEGDKLAPVAAQLKKAVDPIYGVPFTFYVHRSLVPNAFVVYGPRVYVNRGLIRLAKSREELAAVLCHELSHTLHRDGINDDKAMVRYDQRTKRLLTRIERMTPGRFKNRLESAAFFGENFIWLHHSRRQETRADLAGADLCAKANFNPWGMVWIFRKLDGKDSGGPLSFLAQDHPSTRKRIAALRNHLKKNNALFSAWSDDESTATPL